MTEDEMISWYHQLNGHESEQTLGDGKGQASLECCSLQDHRVGHNLVLPNNNGKANHVSNQNRSIGLMLQYQSQSYFIQIDTEREKQRENKDRYRFRITA